MRCGRASAIWTLGAVILLTLAAAGQSVISTRSGIIYFFEGGVYLGDQPLASHPGRFSSMSPGAELRTAEGRAEVLLTPGVFLRIGERSKISMIANELSDTRVELLAGAAVVDSAAPSSGTSVTLIYGNWRVRFLAQGSYRIDSDPPRLWVLQGRAEVSSDAKAGALSVGQGMFVPFAPVLVPEQSIDPPHDALTSWAEGRRQSISADNAIAANIQDPASMSASNTGFDSFTYFPTLYLPPPGFGSSSSSSAGLYQPGFNSIYLPGFTYLPLFLGLGSSAFPLLGRGSGAFPPPVHLPPVRIPPHVGGFPFPRSPAPQPIRPHPMLGHAPGVGVHVGVHR